MTDLLTHMLAEERLREMRKRHLEAERQRVWRTTPTRSTFQRRFQRR